MEANVALDALEDLRNIINANLESMIEEQCAIHGEVAEVSGRILLAGGKRLRPILVHLAYELAGGENSEEIMPLSLASEFIHTATLVHDDINDEALTRRGEETMHSLVGQPKAIIGGDWLFVQGFGLGGRYKEEVVDVMADYCSKLASAEFSQLDHVLDLSTSPEDYLEIVKGKTAGPFAAGCKGAALVANATDAECQELFDFGLELGIAFQLVDDLLDIRGDERMGKPRGADIYEGKMTLPLIHALTLLHGKQRIRLAEIIRNFDDSLFDELISLLKSAESLKYSEILINNHLERALQHISEFKDCEAKQLLKHVVEMVQNRHS
ncbi:MAG: polyprenyl synthetase family protein [Candidatus Poseidoniales archaeon]|nr:MAG: polyprenyl synthetase family protein [Candidatus Poseidoniales archaeon]